MISNVTRSSSYAPRRPHCKCHASIHVTDTSIGDFFFLFLPTPPFDPMKLLNNDFQPRIGAFLCLLLMLVDNVTLLIYIFNIDNFQFSKTAIIFILIIRQDFSVGIIDIFAIDNVFTHLLGLCIRLH